MGGPGKKDEVNPEQLFSLGYAGCFLGAANAQYRQLFPKKHPLPPDTTLTLKTSIGADPKGGFGLAVEIELHYSSVESVLSREEAQSLCRPFSLSFFFLFSVISRPFLAYEKWVTFRVARGRARQREF